MPKKHYRVRNWKKYNEALVKRGSITFWLDEAAIANWHANQNSCGRGRPLRYSELAIECALTLRAVFHLTLRSTEGFIHSLVSLGNLGLDVPDYTTLCKRAKTLVIELPRSHSSRSENLHIVVDSTGLKVFGEGEWKVRQHSYSKRRTWRKLHIAVDVSNQEIVSACVTTNACHDKEVLKDLLNGIEGSIEKLSGDGAYDSHENYDELNQRGIEALIPPRKDARIKQHGNKSAKPLARDEVVRQIRQLGRKHWKQISGYHQRSLVETAMFRLKTIFGDRLRSRVFENQANEAFIRCSALNRMTQLGMPESYVI